MSEQQFGVQQIRGNRYNLRGFIFQRGMVYRVSRAMRDHLVLSLRTRGNLPYFQDVLLDQPLPAPLAPPGFNPNAPYGPGAVAAGGQAAPGYPPGYAPAPVYPPAPAPGVAPAPVYAPGTAPAPTFVPAPAPTTEAQLPYVQAPVPGAELLPPNEAAPMAPAPHGRVNIVAPGAPQVAPQGPMPGVQVPVDVPLEDPGYSAAEVILGAEIPVIAPTPQPQPPADPNQEYLGAPDPAEAALAVAASAPVETPQAVGPVAPAPVAPGMPGMAGPAGGAAATGRRGPGVGSQIRNEQARSALSSPGKPVEVA